MYMTVMVITMNSSGVIVSPVLEGDNEGEVFDPIQGQSFRECRLLLEGR